METVSESVLDEMTRRLVQEFEPEQVILFGSYAWGHPTADSDIDLLVVVPRSQLSATQRMIRAHLCLADLNVAKDILIRTTDEVERMRHVYASLEAEILERGVILYDKGQQWMRPSAN